jgi:NADPH2:quinone reductase
MIKLLRENNIPLINVVRRDEQIDLLKEKYQAEYVLNSEKDGFVEELTALSRKLGANVCLECVAGDLPGKIAAALCKNGIIISYGQLSE